MISVGLSNPEVAEDPLLWRARLTFASYAAAVLSAPRVPLCRRIDERCEAMLSVGLLEEVASQLEQKKLLPSCPAGRAIGYRQTMAYLLRDKSSRGDAAALREYVESFTAASRRYAAQQTKVGRRPTNPNPQSTNPNLQLRRAARRDTRVALLTRVEPAGWQWFRSEPAFEWVAADWDEPQRVVEAVAARVALGRDEFAAGLAAPEQATLRAIKPEEGQAMRLYVPKLDCYDPASATFGAVLLRADACHDRLQPHLAQIHSADDELAKRFPWKKEASAEPAGATDDGNSPKRARGAGTAPTPTDTAAAPAPAAGATQTGEAGA